MSSVTNNFTASSSLNPIDSAADLALKLQSAPEKTQVQLIQELGQMGESGLSVLMEFLRERQARLIGAEETANGSALIMAAGKAYQTLLNANSAAATEFLQTHFPTGIVPLRSEAGIDYAPLQVLLARQDFLQADKLTLEKLCELAGGSAVQRKWLYFTEVDQFAIADLQTINALWLAHSEGKFGFSVQREIWLGVGKNWDKLWSKIGWKDGNNWTRYPQAFTWDLTAPRGHLPLSNQLRGVRVIAALLAHPAWS